MKNIIIFSILAIATNCFIKTTEEDQHLYYILVKRNDKLYQKITHHRSVEMNYLCGCHANKKDLHFVLIDTNKKYFADTLPVKNFSMNEFAQIANKKWDKFKEMDLMKDDIYLVEEMKNHKYQYYKVTFFPVPHEE